jgi:hypothetical protein
MTTPKLACYLLHSMRMPNCRLLPASCAWIIGYCTSVGAVGCVATTHSPPTAASIQAVGIEVDTPPPAALPEVIEAADADDSVWVDGYWDWSGGRWVWLRGGCVKPPQSAAYFPGFVSYGEAPRILYVAPSWVSNTGKALSPPKVTCAPTRPRLKRSVEVVEP